MAHCTLGLDSVSWLESQLTVNAGKVLAFWEIYINNIRNSQDLIHTIMNSMQWKIGWFFRGKHDTKKCRYATQTSAQLVQGPMKPRPYIPGWLEGLSLTPRLSSQISSCSVGDKIVGKHWYKVSPEQGAHASIPAPKSVPSIITETAVVFITGHQLRYYSGTL